MRPGLAKRAAYGESSAEAGYLWLVRRTYRVLIDDGREKQSGHTV